MARVRLVPRRSRCPINAALETLGDAWSLLVVRDLMLKGRTTFKAFLEAEEGIASNVLADRLRRLLDAGVVERRPDPSDGRRSIYRLTEAGIDLAPVLVDLVVWGARHARTAAPPAVVRRMERDRERVIAELRAGWRRTR